jgi:hypothetical protein
MAPASPPDPSIPAPAETAELDAEQGRPSAPDKLPKGPQLVTYDPAQDREKARGLMAQALILILGTIVLFTFVTLWWSGPYVKPADLKDLLAVLLGPIAALVGSATGFYFGGKSGNNAG